MIRPLAALFFALALPLAACVHVEVRTSTGPGDAAPLKGVWEGVGVQHPAGMTAETWPIRLVLNPAGDGAVSYPSLNCGGPMTRTGRAGGAIHYNEVITYGADNCITGGKVTLIRHGDRLFWYWTGEGSDDPEVSAAAVLTRTGD